MNEPPPLGIPPEDWAVTPVSVRVALLALLPLLPLVAENQRLQAQVTHLQARVADLEARLNQHSGNSSKPPSSDPPGAPPRSATRQRARQPGGQPDHGGASRDPAAPDQITETILLRPDCCFDCGTDLSTCPLDSTAPLRHQVWDLSVVRPTVTEYQRPSITCPACAMPVRANLPPEVPRGVFGPGVAAAIALLHTDYRLSLREIPRLLMQFFHLPISVGATTQLYHAVGTAAAAPYAAVEAEVRQHDANLDETSWPQAKLPLWLWTMVTAVATLFRIGRRNRATLTAMVGAEFGGIITSDRLRVYASQPQERWQICWAHLRREFVAFYERDGPVGDWAATALIQIDLTFLLWHGVRAGVLSREALQASMTGIQTAFHTLLIQGKDLPWEKARGFSRDLANYEVALWTFVREAGIEPTNNAAERALRPAVLWRKGCFGTQTETGSQAVERLLTIRATCRQHGRDPLVYLTDLMRTHWAGTPAPSLFTGT